MEARRKRKDLSKKGGQRKPQRSLPPTVASVESGAKDKPKRGIKTHSRELELLIEMANLAGDRDLPHDHFEFAAFERIDALLSAILELDDPLRSHLLRTMSDPERAATAIDMVKAGFKPERAEAASKAAAVSAQYQRIRGARQVLRRVVEGDKRFPAEVFLERRTNGKGAERAHYSASENIQPLVDPKTDLRDIRNCAVCGKFFLARRISSAVCDPESPCAATYAKRQERQNKKRREELAKLKQKRPAPARKR